MRMRFAGVAHWLELVLKFVSEFGPPDKIMAS
jgi:hypothetical protein